MAENGVRGTGAITFDSESHRRRFRARQQRDEGLGGAEGGRGRLRGGSAEEHQFSQAAKREEKIWSASLDFNGRSRTPLQVPRAHVVDNPDQKDPREDVGTQGRATPQQGANCEVPGAIGIGSERYPADVNRLFLYILFFCFEGPRFMLPVMRMRFLFFPSPGRGTGALPGGSLWGADDGHHLLTEL